jgi:hypothetical protein
VGVLRSRVTTFGFEVRIQLQRLLRNDSSASMAFLPESTLSGMVLTEKRLLF